jgi:hypothetical protein
VTHNGKIVVSEKTQRRGALSRPQARQQPALASEPATMPTFDEITGVLAELAL